MRQRASACVGSEVDCRGLSLRSASIVRFLLILILLFIVVWWAQRALQRFGAAARARRERMKQKGRSREQIPERILSCAHCGLHVPESEGVIGEGRFFCCDAHRRRALGRDSED